jgi:hypothetical protein
MTGLQTADEFMDKLWAMFSHMGYMWQDSVYVYRDGQTFAAAAGYAPPTLVGIAPRALAMFQADEVTLVVDTWVSTLAPDDPERAGRTNQQLFDAGESTSSEGLWWQRAFADGSTETGYISYVRHGDGTVDRTDSVSLNGGSLTGRATIAPETLAYAVEMSSLLGVTADALGLTRTEADLIVAKVFSRDYGVDFTLFYSAEDDTERDAMMVKMKAFMDENGINAFIEDIGGGQNG